MTRELLINEAGFYEVRVHDRINGQMVLTASYVPTRNDAPLSEIPFVLLNTEDSLHDTTTVEHTTTRTNSK